MFVHPLSPHSWPMAVISRHPHPVPAPGWHHDWRFEQPTDRHRKGTKKLHYPATQERNNREALFSLEIDTKTLRDHNPLREAPEISCGRHHPHDSCSRTEIAEEARAVTAPLEKIEFIKLFGRTIAARRRKQKGKVKRYSSLAAKPFRHKVIK